MVIKNDASLLKIFQHLSIALSAELTFFDMAYKACHSLAIYQLSNFISLHFSGETKLLTLHQLPR